MEIKDLPQLGEATESDHVVSSISQKTRLISFKNIFEKISFSSLVTTAKNIIGSINELKGRCDTLDTSVSKLNTDYGSRKHYYKELTVTSDAAGRISFGSNIPSTAYEVVANVITNGQRYCVAPFIFNDGTWYSALLSDVDFSRSTNVTVNVRVSYWD